MTKSTKSFLRPLWCAFFALPLLAAGSLASAESVLIPLGHQGKAWQIETPRHGLNKNQVVERFGEPQQKKGPVGDPPIHAWEYAQFTVYFEGDHVIHSVVKYSPEQTAE